LREYSATVASRHIIVAYCDHGVFRRLVYRSILSIKHMFKYEQTITKLLSRMARRGQRATTPKVLARCIATLDSFHLQWLWLLLLL